jgi:hypothetical protein
MWANLPAGVLSQLKGWEMKAGVPRGDHPPRPRKGGSEIVSRLDASKAYLSMCCPQSLFVISSLTPYRAVRYRAPSHLHKRGAYTDFCERSRDGRHQQLFDAAWRRVNAPCRSRRSKRASVSLRSNFHRPNSIATSDFGTLVSLLVGAVVHGVADLDRGIRAMEPTARACAFGAVLAEAQRIDGRWPRPAWPRAHVKEDTPCCVCTYMRNTMNYMPQGEDSAPVERCASVPRSVGGSETRPWATGDGAAQGKRWPTAGRTPPIQLRRNGRRSPVH